MQPEWITDGYPQEPGDFLWVEMWGCDCCVNRSGIAWVHDVAGDDAEHLPPINYKTADGKHLGISWEGSKPTFKEDDPTKPAIDGWLKVSPLPKSGRLKG